ncbi:hypothetical protein L1049_010331 [Liquidambar formosana]|uniref:FBD domain-containing protein n=1 Tax=Liquidambar formosana TaxID=63359 RepID=A0AAP0NAW7_LIQFO
MGSQKAPDQTMSQLMIPPPEKRVRRRHSGVNINNRAPTNLNVSLDVLEHIFSYFPIKNAVRMGLLCTRLKKSWLYNRNFYFGRDFARGRVRGEIINIVSRIFSVHRGETIRCLRLYIEPAGVETIVECWIKKAIDKHLEELDLDFSLGLSPFKLSAEFLDIESLTVLKLCFCELDLDLPLNLNGLRFLGTLALRNVSLTEELIENLFGYCMNLEVLELILCDRINLLNIFAEDHRRFKVLKVGECEDIFRIDIYAPTLCSFYYCGNVSYIHFYSSTLQLKDAVLHFMPTRGYLLHLHMRNVILNLVHVTVLTMNSTFLEGLCSNTVDGELREMQFSLWNLKEFQLFMEGGSYCNPFDIVSFLKNCPRVEKIFIDFGDFSFECGYYWELHAKRKFEQCRPLFNHLKVIKLKGFKFQHRELELLNFFLGRATFLETLTLVTPRNINRRRCGPELRMYEQYFNSWRASPNANVTICGPSNDKCNSPVHPKNWY